jgi:hypothetical protein
MPTPVVESKELSAFWSYLLLTVIAAAATAAATAIAHHLTTLNKNTTSN